MRRRRVFNVGGVEVKSGLEEKIGKQLIKEGVEFEYERESYPWEERLPRAFCKECDTKICYVMRSYTPDYFLGNGIILEVKGRFTSKDRKIAAAMKEQHPELDLRMVFDRDNWLNKSHKSKYSDWCNAKDIQYATGLVPLEWLR